MNYTQLGLLFLVFLTFASSSPCLDRDNTYLGCYNELDEVVIVAKRRERPIFLPNHNLAIADYGSGSEFLSKILKQGGK